MARMQRENIRAPVCEVKKYKMRPMATLRWLLKNGDVYRGMPRWSGLPEQERWQIIAYIRSLGPSTFAEGQK